MGQAWRRGKKGVDSLSTFGSVCVRQLTDHTSFFLGFLSLSQTLTHDTQRYARWLSSRTKYRPTGVNGASTFYEDGRGGGRGKEEEEGEVTRGLAQRCGVFFLHDLAED